MMTAAIQSQVNSAAAEIDVELFTFVERYATNPVRWDLLLFFGSHPSQAVTIPELAKETHRAVRAVTKEVDDLAYLGVLTRRYTPAKVTYQLVRRGPARRSVTRLAALAAGGKAE